MRSGITMDHNNSTRRVGNQTRNQKQIFCPRCPAEPHLFLSLLDPGRASHTGCSSANVGKSFGTNNATSVMQSGGLRLCAMAFDIDGITQLLTSKSKTPAGADTAGALGDGWFEAGVAQVSRQGPARDQMVSTVFCSPIEKDATLNALAVEAFNEKTRQAPSEKNLLLKENDVNEAAPMVAASAVANGPLYRSAGPPFSVGNMPSYIARASRIRRARSRSRFRIN